MPQGFDRLMVSPSGLKKVFHHNSVMLQKWRQEMISLKVNEEDSV